ncbi:hypothetical protein RHGRI_021927 [Rhododendron griersonianum]|uniref:Ent-kaurene oxidase n=1 Tax=Rhododendron griersonianum TaxID=479676 RepID=A0AAV6JT17_9ERIC|nr:hypothetical protein RHGRI_021925 [Rhododendron griersonianum]KAG5542224.1 hypothetical protein RHGRI_021927 [Rhododendron griersonianum]
MSLMELMDQVGDLQALPKGTTIALGATAVVLGQLFLWLINRYFQEHRRRRSPLPAVPEVPGLPVIGNALQLREKKPHMTFVKWVKTYGPIFSIRVGSKSIVVLNNNDVAKEAMVTRFSSISTRKLPKALSLLTSDKCMVASSDYDDFHKTVKRHIITNVLGPNAQKRHRCHRDTMIANIVKDFHAHVKNNGIQPVNFRNVFQSELFGLAMKESVGSDVQSIYVEELGRLSKHEIFGILFKDLVGVAIDLDWREFYPCLNWIPNRTLERRIEKLTFRRQAVMMALIKEQSKRVTSKEEVNNCYLNYLLREGKELTEKQIAILLWEVILLASDTTMVTSEWAMFELAKNPKLHDRLYQEVQSICGSGKITEEMLCQLPYLEAVFHETLRKYPPIPLPFLRFAHEDTEIGGYYIPAGTEIAINFYGCNMDENQWEKPEEWNPDRFLDKKYDRNDMNKTMAFGGGKRACTGYQQAMLIACTAIGRLVQEFEWRLEDGEEENVDIVGIINQKLHPMHSIIRPRN